MTSPSELQLQSTIKERVIAAISLRSEPFDAASLAAAAKADANRVSHYLGKLYRQKLLKRMRSLGAMNRIKFVYAKPEWNLFGYDLIDRRRLAAAKRKRSNALSSLPQSEPPASAAQLSISVGSKKLDLTISEARTLYSELGALFDVARSG